jgi:hypothetical protein
MFLTNAYIQVHRWSDWTTLTQAEENHKKVSAIKNRHEINAVVAITSATVIWPVYVGAKVSIRLMENVSFNSPNK